MKPPQVGRSIPKTLFVATSIIVAILLLRSAITAFVSPHPAGLSNGIMITGHLVHKNPDLTPLLEQIRPINGKSLVVNIKDADGSLTIPLKTPVTYGLAAYSDEAIDFHKWTSMMKRRGYETIIYLVAFKDKAFAKVYPEEAVKRTDGTIFYDGHGTFIDPASASYQNYLLRLLDEIGDIPNIDEIMLDYIRYPDPQYGHLTYPHPLSQHDQATLIVSFAARAARVVRSHGKRISLAVFPPTSDELSPFGQDFLKLAEVVDIISPMIYPHLNWKVHNVDEWKKMFENCHQTATTLTDKAGSKLRPWIAGFWASWQNASFGKKQVYRGQMPRDLMAWQLDFLTQRKIPFLVFNSRAEYNFDH